MPGPSRATPSSSPPRARSSSRWRWNGARPLRSCCTAWCATQGSGSRPTSSRRSSGRSSRPMGRRRANTEARASA